MAELLGDADLSLGIQDRLKCGNKVRVLLSGLATLRLMTSPLIGQIPQRKSSSAITLLFQARQMPTMGRRGDVDVTAAGCWRGPYYSVMFRCGRKTALSNPHHACPVCRDCQVLGSVVVIAPSRGRQATRDVGCLKCRAGCAKVI